MPGGYEVITDGIITDWVRQVFVDGAREAGVVHFIVLLPDQEIAAQRARARSVDPIRDYGPYLALYSLFAEDAAHAVDTGDVAPKDLAPALRAGIEAGRFRLAG